MTGFVVFLPFIVLAQALGVGLAWAVDALSWKWRANENAVFATNFMATILSFPILLVLPALQLGTQISIPLMSAPFLVLAWVLLVAWVQKQQLKLPLRATFFGALMQLVCFDLSLLSSVVLLLIFRFLSFPGWCVVVYFFTATLTYALSALFRPAIYGTWQTYHQNSGKNRPPR